MKQEKAIARLFSGKKAFTLMLAVLLVLGCSVGATLAYLTATTDEVTNTFTVGKVAITLDEADVDVYGVKEKEIINGVEQDKARVTANTYKLIPGHKYTKDPTIHVAEGSEPCYVFVKVVNPIASIEAPDVEGEQITIAAQMAQKGWNACGEDYPGIYYNMATFAAGKDIKVFESFTLADNADVSGYTNEQITIQAAAVQAEGFDDVSDAWANNDSLFGTSTPDPVEPAE